jgi:hypothetical protein
MRLPYDFFRCVGLPEQQCHTCARAADPGGPYRQSWMAPYVSLLPGQACPDRHPCQPHGRGGHNAMFGRPVDGCNSITVAP